MSLLGNVFHITDPSCGMTGGFSSQRANDMELLHFPCVVSLRNVLKNFTVAGFSRRHGNMTFYFPLLVDSCVRTEVPTGPDRLYNGRTFSEWIRFTRKLCVVFIVCNLERVSKCNDTFRKHDQHQVIITVALEFDIILQLLFINEIRINKSRTGTDVLSNFIFWFKFHRRFTTRRCFMWWPGATQAIVHYLN